MPDLLIPDEVKSAAEEYNNRADALQLAEDSIDVAEITEIEPTPEAIRLQEELSKDPFALTEEETRLSTAIRLEAAKKYRGISAAQVPIEDFVVEAQKNGLSQETIDKVALRSVVQKANWKPPGANPLPPLSEGYTYGESLGLSKPQLDLAITEAVVQRVTKAYHLDKRDISEIQEELKKIGLTKEATDRAWSRAAYLKLTEGKVANALLLDSTSPVPDEVFQLPQFKEGLINYVEHVSSYPGDVREFSKKGFKDLQKKLGLADAEFYPAAIKGQINSLLKRLGNDREIFDTYEKRYFLDLQKLDIPKSYLESKEFLELSSELMLKALKSGDMAGLRKVSSEIDWPKELEANTEVQTAAQELFTQLTKRGYPESVGGELVSLSRIIKLDPDFLAAESTKVEVDKIARKIVGYGPFHLGDLFDLNSEIGVSDKIIFAPKTVKVTEAFLTDNLGKIRANKGWADEAIEVAKAVNGFESKKYSAMIQGATIQEAALNGLEHCLGNIDLAASLAAEFRLPVASVTDSIAKSISVNHISVRWSDGISHVPNLIKKYSEAFDIPETEIERAIGANLTRRIMELVDKGKIDDVRKLTTELMKVLPEQVKEIDKTFDIFGNFITLNSFQLVTDIMSGELSEEMKSLGIKSAGEVGVNQLREAIQKFKKELVRDAIQPEDILGNHILEDFMLSAVRLKSSSWGTRSENYFLNKVEAYAERLAEGKLEPLRPEYKSSEVVRVPLIDKEKQSEFKFTEAFTDRYAVIRDSIQGALELTGEKKPLSLLAQRVEQKKAAVLDDLAEKLAKSDNLIAKENLEKKIDELKAINPRSIHGFQRNFEALAQYKDFHEELREMVFFMALHGHPATRESVRGYLHEQPKLDDISGLLDFVQHITNQETMSKYFTDKNSNKAFQRMINTASFDQEVARAQNQHHVGTVPIQFVPSRGLLMEFSGHYADACWASRYESIAEEFPNVTAVAMVQSPENKNVRLAGAAMLIECESADDQPLLVVRGLNPIENMINSVSVEDYYREFTEYVKVLAEKTGRKAAIVLSPQTGMASTNRPVLLDFLKKELKGKKVVSHLYGKTEFNGYHIADSGDGNAVYLLD